MTDRNSLTNQKLEWLRLDRAAPINDDAELYRLLVQCTTEGVAVDFKVGMKLEDVCGALRDLAARLERRADVEPPATPVLPFTHWSKDPMIPYDGCACSSCQEMRRYRGDLNRPAEPT